MCGARGLLLNKGGSIQTHAPDSRRRLEQQQSQLAVRESEQQQPEQQQQQHRVSCVEDPYGLNSAASRGAGASMNWSRFLPGPSLRERRPRAE